MKMWKRKEERVGLDARDVPPLVSEIKTNRDTYGVLYEALPTHLSVCPEPAII